MQKKLLRQFDDELQKQRRAETARHDQALRSITETRQAEIEEECQQERDAHLLEELHEQQEGRLHAIDDARARIEAGTYGRCTKCEKTLFRIFHGHRAH